MLTVAAYFGVWNFSFVYDDSVVLHNPFNQSISPIAKFFMEPGVYMNNPDNPQVWRPLGAFARTLTVIAFGYRPAFYHVLNLIFHLINIVLVYALVYSLTRKKWLAGFTAAVIGVHPALTEAVTHVSSFSTLLWASLFLMTCLLICHRKPPIMPILVFGAALLTKESVLPGAAIILALIWWRDFEGVFSWKIILKRWAPYAVLAAFYGFARSWILPDIVNFLPNSHLAIPYAIYKYALAIIWPAFLIIFDAQQKNFITPTSLLDPRAVVGIFIAAIFVALLVFCFRKKWLEEFFGLLWFGFFMLPFIQIINIGVYIGTRSLYVPAIGLIMAVSGMIGRVVPREFFRDSLKWRRIIYTATMIFLVLLAALAYVRNQDWRNGETLWKSVLGVDPKSVVARVNLAYYYLGEGQSAQKALEVSQEQLRLYPKHFGGWLTLADSYMAIGELDRAKSEYLRLLRTYPGNDRVQRRFNFLHQGSGINSGISAYITGSGGAYFEVRSIADKDLIIPWSEEAGKEFRIFLPPGDYYIRFQGADSKRFTVQKESWFPIAIQL